MKRFLDVIKVPYTWVGIGLAAFALGLSVRGPQGLLVGLILAWALSVLRLLYTLRREGRQLSALLALWAVREGEREADDAAPRP